MDKFSLGEISFINSIKIKVGVSDVNFGRRIKMVKEDKWVVRIFYYDSAYELHTVLDMVQQIKG